MGAGRSAGGPSRERPRRRPEQVDGLLLVAERQRAGAALSARAGSWGDSWALALRFNDLARGDV